MSAADVVIVAATIAVALVLVVLFWLRNTPPRGNSTAQRDPDAHHRRDTAA